MADGPALTVVVPTLNEEGNVGPLLEELDACLEGVPHEVIVVDDGSEDRTRVEASRAHPNVHVVHRPGGGGLASAVVRGIELARGGYVCVMDGDRQHPAQAVPDLLRAARWRDADLVIGSRYTGKGCAPGFPWHRRLISWGARTLILAALPSTREAGLTDPTSGLFLFERAKVQARDLSPSGYKILLEVLEKGRFTRVEEVGYTFRSRTQGESNLSLGTIRWTLTHLAELAWADRENRRLIQFATVGLLGILVNLGLLTLLTEEVGLHYIASAGIAVQASILSNFALNDAWTFRDMRQGTWSARLWRFNAVSLLALLVNLSVLSLMTELLGIYYLVSEVVAIGVAFATNYRGNVDWTYVEVAEQAHQAHDRSTWQKLRESSEQLTAQVREKVSPHVRWVSSQEDDLG